MKTIWKFHLETTNEQQIALPIGAEILSFGVQDLSSLKYVGYCRSG